MQVVVKKPHIRIDGDIPKLLIEFLEKNYSDVEVITKPDEEYIDIEDTAVYKNTIVTPGDAVRIYRENKEWTQAELGEKLGGIPKQTISNIETGTRPISKKMAINLSKLFEVTVDNFI